MLSIPIPYLSAVLQALLAVLLMQRRGDARTIAFIAISASMVLLVGLRWSFAQPYLWFALALVSSVQAPVAWLCFDRSSGRGEQREAGMPIKRASQWAPLVAAVLTGTLLLAGRSCWDWVGVLLVALYMGYGGALLGLGWGNHARFDGLRVSQVPDIRQAAIWAGWALLFNGVVEGLVGVDYWLHNGRHAPMLVSLAHGLLLPMLLYGVWCAGRVFASGDVASATSSAIPSTAWQPRAAMPAAQSVAAPDGMAGTVNLAGHMRSAEQIDAMLTPGTDAERLATSADVAYQEAADKRVAGSDACTVARLTELVQGQELFRDPDLSLIKLARRMGVPARELSAAVNRQCGKNIAQWINAFRIAAACERLAGSDAPVTGIMLECGFFTKSNFNREFRRHTGLSPSAYRQRAQSGAWPPAQLASPSS